MFKVWNKQTKKILSELCSSDPCVFYQELEKVKSCWSIKMKMIMKNLLFCFLSFWLPFLIYFSCCSWRLFREQNKITAVTRFITLESIIQGISKSPQIPEMQSTQPWSDSENTKAEREATSSAALEMNQTIHAPFACTVPQKWPIVKIKTWSLINNKTNVYAVQIIVCSPQLSISLPLCGVASAA